MACLPDRCALHPNRRVVGICGICLRDRLSLLNERVGPDSVANGGPEARPGPVLSFRPVGADENGRLTLVAPRTHLLSRERSVPIFNPDTKASAETAIHRHENLEGSISSALNMVKQAQEQLSFAAQSPYQGGEKLELAGPPLTIEEASVPASKRRNNASVTDAKSLPGAMDTSGKRKGSWLSISKAKSPLLTAPLPQIGRKHNDKNGAQSSPHVAILAGRKSASDAVGRSCNRYRQAHMAELGSMTEINLGDAAIKVERNECNGDARANSSWISSLFLRRKGPRLKMDEQPDAVMNCSSVATNGPSQKPIDGSANRSPLPSAEPGRLSWDGPRSSAKQMLKRVETRRKQQRVDSQPSPCFTATNGGNGCFEDAVLLQSTPLYKCKSVAASRKSPSVDIPQRSCRQLHPSPMFLGDANANARIEPCNGHWNGREPRSWGRAWNRTLSPLLGFRTYSGKAPLDLGNRNEGYATSNHVNHVDSLAGAPSSANSYVSPLTRSQCPTTTDAPIQIAL